MFGNLDGSRFPMIVWGDFLRIFHRFCRHSNRTVRLLRCGHIDTSTHRFGNAARGLEQMSMGLHRIWYDR